MANTIGWGKGTQNNTNGWGKYQNTIDAGSVYADSYAGETVLVGTSAAFSYSKSSYHQDEADPTPTITGTTGGSFNASAGLVFVDTGTHNSTTGQIDLSASTIDSHIITYNVDGVQSGQTVGVTASPFITNDFSMQFDGAGDYITLGSGNYGFSSLTTNGQTLDNLSISVWFKNQGGSGNQSLLTWWASGSGSQPYLDAFLSYNPSTRDVRFGDSWPNAYTFPSAATNWTHMVAVKTTSNAYIYVNGSLVSTKGSSLSFGFNRELRIGGNQGSGEWFNGKIDEVALWNTALGETAIQEIYNATANNTGKVLDLNTDSGNYTSSANLQYWNRLGD